VSLVALVVLVPAATGAAAEPLPTYDGGMTFQSIQGSAGPEEYSWEVNLGEGQDLRQVDNRNAAVYYTESEHLAFSIQAVEAHDAIGTTVPTSLAVSRTSSLLRRLRGARVVKQFRRAGRSLPVGAQVGVKLLVPEPPAPKRK
jgi:hypothetical protein